jgi:hypothetical protein
MKIKRQQTLTSSVRVILNYRWFVEAQFGQEEKCTWTEKQQFTTPHIKHTYLG